MLQIFRQRDGDCHGDLQVQKPPVYCLLGRCAVAGGTSAFLLLHVATHPFTQSSTDISQLVAEAVGGEMRSLAGAPERFYIWHMSQFIHTQHDDTTNQTPS